MARYTETAKSKLVGRVAGRVKHGRGGAAAGRFVEEFFRHVAPEDVFTLGEETLQGAALSAWSQLQSRRRGKLVLRAYNPAADEHGFDLGYTVVEMVNDDMPFLVDSVNAELNGTNIIVHRLIHPVVHVRRGAEGELEELFGPKNAPADTFAESVIQLHIDYHSRAEDRTAIENRLRTVLDDVRDSVTDWPKMRDMVVGTITDIESKRPPVAARDIDEAIAFLRWLKNEHFTFLGYREYRFVDEDGTFHIEIKPGTGLGILRKSSVQVYEGLLEVPELPPEVAAFLQAPELLTVGKANRRATVQRATHMDTVAVRLFDAEGRVVGGRLFAGLFASPVFTSSPRQIPVLRGKVAWILEASGFDPNSHDGRGLLHILETLPRDELFQIDGRRLLETGLGILRFRERQRVALFAHPDPLGRWVSCLVYVPRDRFDTRLRQRLAAIVTAGFGGTLSSFQTSISDEPMARIHFAVRTVPGSTAPHTPDEIERQLAGAARDWREDLCERLVERYGAEQGRELVHIYGDAFPHAYRDRYDAGEAASDIEHVAATIDGDTIVFHLYRRQGEATSELRLKLYRRDRAQPLSDVLPVLENMGVRVIDEIPQRVVPTDVDHVVWIHDFGLEPPSGTEVDLRKVKGLFEETLRSVCRGDIENDGFNSLVLAAGLPSRRIVVLRAYCKFLLQAGIPFSQTYMESTLARHPSIARAIVALFETLFAASNGDGEDAAVKRLQGKIERALQDVSALDEDRILRRFTNAVTATLRTNFFQKGADGGEKSYVSFKLDSRALDELPLPRPFVEIFVYSPRVEAVHLRGGKVARGGIRWSDRREDYRTEVLGLMKAQMTKNSVIVPVGAKGGFVVKRPPAEGGREAVLREGIECYRTLIRGMLDVTDNLVDERIMPPADVVRRDGDDPYLVVAADKGTASFSDIANSIAEEHGFWLGDAFASGGSAGYDHKEMGITARGAWESIKRHFREMGVDAMTTDFTCIGVGDMSGDVFGNGALYTAHMRLVAAFNHLHVFVDPSPDAAASFRERKRLFDLPRSSWGDYDHTLISRGGGVFERSAKAIRVSTAMRTLFGLGKKSTITPNELVRAILKCRVDLVFFGGIGTFVRSRHESDAEVGDRGNDSVRIMGREVGARIIGEGANLAITQRGRIEYALAGGRINTDFIDNSGGVDCSDHEVNIKIPLNRAVAAGKLSRPKRDRLLAGMTEDVAILVLRDNYRQSNALSEAERQSAALLDDHARFLATLEKDDRLDRTVEDLPSVEEIDERRADGKGLTRPELAVLLAYAKIVLFEEVLESDLADDPHLADGIGGYFPKPMRKQFADLLLAHPLRREITSTYVANTVVNRTGPAFVSSVQERTGAPAADVARAYLASRRVFRANDLWADIDELDDRMDAALLTELRLDILALMKRATVWFVRKGPRGVGIDEAVAGYAPSVDAVEKHLDRLIPASRKQTRDQRASYYREKGAPHALSRRIANLDILAAACDIAHIAADEKIEVTDAARAYYELGARLGADWLRQSSTRLVVEGDRWRKAAALGLVDDLYSAQAELAAKLVEAVGVEAAQSQRVEQWLRGRGQALDRLQAVVADLRSSPRIELSMLSVAAADMRALNGG